MSDRFDPAWLTRLNTLRTIPDPAGRYWMYGAGGFGRAVSAELVRLGLDVEGFIDRRGPGTVEGLPCRHPDTFSPEEAACVRLVYGVMNHATPSGDVMHWAEGRGFAALHFPSDFYVFPGFAPPTYWLADPRVLLAALPHLEALSDSLADDESRHVLRDLLAYRITTDPRRHPRLAAGEQYFPDFLDAILPARDGPVTFIDGGAFDGDTLDALMRSNLQLREWVAFEPDPRNARTLAARVARLGDSLPASTIVQAGLGARSGLVRFDASAAAASRVLTPGESDGPGTVTIRVVALDEIPRRAGPLYVKLDIEGSESDALRGMARVLHDRPVLALSVYHRPSDLWEIPRLVQALYPHARLRLRQHGHHGFDTVLYAAPH